MISQLTNKQKKLIPQIRDKWLNKVFQKSERLKFGEEKVIADCKWLYKLCKLDEPDVVICDSPLACQNFANLDQAGGLVRQHAWLQIGDQVENHVRDQVWAQVMDQVGAQVGAQVWDQVWDQVEDQVWDQVWDQVNGQARVQFGDYFGSVISGDISDYGWVSFIDYIESIGLELPTIYSKYIEYCETPKFYSIQLRGLNIVSRPPTELRYIEKGGIKKLHCEDAPAIEFADGYCQHYIHGVFIPPKLFAKAKTMSYGEIISIKNIEQRYAILQMEANQGKMLKAMELVDTYSIHQKVLSNEITKYPVADLILSDIFKQFSSEKTVKYELYKTKDDNFFGEVAYFLSYHCPSTGRHYMSGIDPNIALKGAKASILWKSGKTEEEFNNIVLHS